MAWRRLLYELVLPIGEHVVRRGDRRKQQQDAVVEGVAGIGWMGWGSMDSMEAEVGREDMGRLLCWSVNGPYLLYLAATPFFFNGREGGPAGLSSS